VAQTDSEADSLEIAEVDSTNAPDATGDRPRPPVHFASISTPTAFTPIGAVDEPPTSPSTPAPNVTLNAPPAPAPAFDTAARGAIRKPPPPRVPLGTEPAIRPPSASPQASSAPPPSYGSGAPSQRPMTQPHNTGSPSSAPFSSGFPAAPVQRPETSGSTQQQAAQPSHAPPPPPPMQHGQHGQQHPQQHAQQHPPQGSHAPPPPQHAQQHPQHGMHGPPAPMGHGPSHAPQPMHGAPSQAPQAMGGGASLAVRTDNVARAHAALAHVRRTHVYSFALDARGMPVELGSGRFAKAYLGEEQWLESKTNFRREVVIKIVQKGVSEEDLMRFQMEKELLERVQGHPNIVQLFASGEGEDPAFIPAVIRDKVDPEFMILERLEMSLEERLKGSRNKHHKDDLLAAPMTERVFRVLDYMIPVASAVEHAHLSKNVCHRDIKPANILIGLPDPNLRGSTLQVRLADFNVAKLHDDEVNFGMTQMRNAVPGTLFFQSPEQETNIIELLVNVQQGVPEVEYFEDFYIQIAKNDSFSLFNRGEQYPILYADRARKRLVLGRPYRDVTETNVRARIQKSVGRPADIYSLGALLYYLISGAYANPKTLYDAFHKFVEYERADENNTIDAYLRHEYSVINSLRAPKQDGTEVAPADRFFSYKHYLDGNGELIDPNVLLIVAKCMIRNKPDSYCQAHDLETRGASELVQDLIDLYSLFGVHPSARPTHLARRNASQRGALKVGLDRVGNRLRWAWLSFASMFRKRR
jgi:serine/threonine protein kinase